LSRIQPLTLVSRRGRAWQYVPKRIAHERDLSSQYVKLVPEDVLSFRLPMHVQRNHRQMMESLAFMSINFLPDFTMTNLKGETRIPFELGEFSRVQKSPWRDPHEKSVGMGVSSSGNGSWNTTFFIGISCSRGSSARCEIA